VLTGIIFGVLVCAILILIGDIGLIIMSYKFYEVEKNKLYLVVFILLLLSLILPFMAFIPYIGTVTTLSVSTLEFIAWILLYIALGDSIRRALAPQPPVTTPSQPILPPPV